MKRNVLIGVSGGISAYKTCEVVGALTKKGYDVKVVMTKHATEFVTPLTFGTLSKNPARCEMFSDGVCGPEHIALAKWADVFAVAPATADIIGKFAGGIADDLLTSVFAAYPGKTFVCPAMNTNMYENARTASNIALLKDRGVEFIEPGYGRLACGDAGKGRMAEPSEIVRVLDGYLIPAPDFRGKKILITAGATLEDVDGVRFISNYSSGKMGTALAEAAVERGAKVIFIAGRTSVPRPKNCEIIEVKSTLDMYGAVMEKIKEADIIIKAAAPADYRVENPAGNKIKGQNVTLKLVKNPDIAEAAGKIKRDKILVVFAAETENLIENASEKLLKKNADIVVANNVTKEGAGFGSDFNEAVLVFRGGEMENLPMMPKTEMARRILDAVLTL